MASSSYGIVNRSARTYTIVKNAESGDDRVDILIDVKPPSPGETRQICKVRSYYEGIKTELFEDGPPYKIARLIFSSDKGSVVSSRYMYYDTSGQVLDYVETQDNCQAAMRLARFLVYCGGIYNDLPKAIEDAVKISAFVKDEDDGVEICVICLDEYQQDRMNVGTLQCKHRFHEECIKNWLKRKNYVCPICRETIFKFKGSSN